MSAGQVVALTVTLLLAELDELSGKNGGIIGTFGLGAGELDGRVGAFGLVAFARATGAATFADPLLLA